MMGEVKIGDFVIGGGRPVFVIAEVGINHNSDIERAKKLIRAAKKAGADAVKFQSFKADKICDMHLTETKDVESVTGGSNSTYDFYKTLEVSDQMHSELIKTAKKEGILFFSSVFDEDTADYLEQYDLPAYKIASGDVSNLPLIEHVAKKGKPMIVSTGMSTLQEVRKIVDICHKAGNTQLILLHCISCYPPADGDLNLNSIKSMADEFPHPIGYSDHCEDMLACFSACCMGARVIEKHFTLDNSWQGPDHKISATTEELGEFIKNLRRAEKMFGSGIKTPALSELDVRSSSRRSIRVLGDLSKGEIITRDRLILLKPEKGLLPEKLDMVIGRRAKVSLKNHEPITFDKLE